MRNGTGLGLAAGVLVGIILAGWALFGWFRAEPAFEIVRMQPGLDGQPERAAGQTGGAATSLEGMFQRFLGTPGTHTGQWLRFRGPAVDNRVPDPSPLRAGWAADSATALWTVELGEGHAGPAVWDGRVYVMDYRQEGGGRDALRCFSLDTGQEIWRRSYASPLKRNHGFSRTVPAVADGCVVAIGPTCKVLCVDARNGDYKWGVDMVATYGTKVPYWYTGQCPLIDGTTVVLAPGGPEALLVGLDLESGRELWRTPNEAGWQMSHSSIVPATIAGRRMYLYAAVGGLAGIAAHGPDAGTRLWSYTEWAPQVVAPSPVVLGEGRIFMTAGYGAGSTVLQVRKTGAGFAADPVLVYGPKEGAACEQQTPVVEGDAMITIMPKDAGALRQQLVVVDAGNPQKMLWSSGKSQRFGLGPYLLAGDKLFVLDDRGELFLYRLNGTQCELLDSVAVLDGRDAWGPMALVDGWLLLRDDTRLACLDVSRSNLK